MKKNTKDAPCSWVLLFKGNKVAIAKHSEKEELLLPEDISPCDTSCIQHLRARKLWTQACPYVLRSTRPYFVVEVSARAGPTLKFHLGSGRTNLNLPSHETNLGSGVRDLPNFKWAQPLGYQASQGQDVGRTQHWVGATLPQECEALSYRSGLVNLKSFKPLKNISSSEIGLLFLLGLPMFPMFGPKHSNWSLASITSTWAHISHFVRYFDGW